MRELWLNNATHFFQRRYVTQDLINYYGLLNLHERNCRCHATALCVACGYPAYCGCVVCVWVFGVCVCVECGCVCVVTYRQGFVRLSSVSWTLWRVYKRTAEQIFTKFGIEGVYFNPSMLFRFDLNHTTATDTSACRPTWVRVRMSASVDVCVCVSERATGFV